LLANASPFALSEVEGMNGARSITHKNQKNQPSTAVLPFDKLRANGNKLSRFYSVLGFVNGLEIAKTREAFLAFSLRLCVEKAFGFCALPGGNRPQHFFQTSAQHLPAVDQQERAPRKAPGAAWAQDDQGGAGDADGYRMVFDPTNARAG
jgi:hypothetical protein